MYVQLADILVAHERHTVKHGSALRDLVNVILKLEKKLYYTYALNENLILLRLVVLDRDTLTHLDVANTLLAKEVADLDALVVTGNDEVNREMGIDSTHLVLEANRHALDHVHDSSLGRAEASKVLASTMPDDKLELVAVRTLDQAHVHGHVAEVLYMSVESCCDTAYLSELTARTLDRHHARVDLDGHVLREFEVQVLVDGQHRGIFCLC